MPVYFCRNCGRRFRRRKGAAELDGTDCPYCEHPLMPDSDRYDQWRDAWDEYVDPDRTDIAPDEEDVYGGS